MSLHVFGNASIWMPSLNLAACRLKGQQLYIIPYSRKCWRELNLAVEPKIAIAKILADLNLWFGTGSPYIYYYLYMCIQIIIGLLWNHVCVHAINHCSAALKLSPCQIGPWQKNLTAVRFRGKNTVIIKLTFFDITTSKSVLGRVHTNCLGKQTLWHLSGIYYVLWCHHCTTYVHY